MYCQTIVLTLPLPQSSLLYHSFSKFCLPWPKVVWKSSPGEEKSVKDIKEQTFDKQAERESCRKVNATTAFQLG